MYRNYHSHDTHSRKNGRDDKKSLMSKLLLNIKKYFHNHKWYCWNPK